MDLKDTFKETADLLIIKRSRFVAIMALALSILSIFACLTGIIKENIYNDVLSSGTITRFLLVGSIAQDIIFLPLALILAGLSVLFIFRPGYKVFISILGFICNFFYGYGLYAIQGQYTSIYLVYLIIFSLSIYSIILGLLSFKHENAVKISLPKGLKVSISIFLSSIVLMLGFIWILRISPDIARHIPQDTYGVFILDLAIVFPALAVTVFMLMRNRPFGNIFAGVALIKAFTVCLSWGFGEWYGRLTGNIQGGFDMLIIPSFLTLVSFILFMLYIRKLNSKSGSLYSTKSASAHF